MNKKKSVLVGAILISLSASLWGFDGVVLTPSLFNLEVPFVVFMLHLIPFVLLSFFLFKEYRYIKKFSKYDWFKIIAIALTGGAFGTLAIVKALFLVNFTHLSVVVLLQKLQPLFAIGLSLFLLKEKISKHFFGFAILAVIGSYFLVFGLHLPSFEAKLSYYQATIYALISAFCFGSATVFGKMLLLKYDSETALFYRYGATSFIMFAVVLFSLGFGGLQQQIKTATSLNWGVFILIAFTTGSTAIYIYYKGLKKVTAGVSSICELFFPISTILFDYIFNDNLLSWIQWLSAAIMVASIYGLSREHSRLNPESPTPDAEVNLA